MEYKLKNGKNILIRQPIPEDAEEIIRVISTADSETRYLAREVGEFATGVEREQEVIKEISQEIFETGEVEEKSEIGSYWWDKFQTSFISAYGDKFVTQRKLEYESLKDTINHFKSSADVDKLSQKMFCHWGAPPIFPESKEFFKTCSIPIYIVSNIDRCDVLKAIDFHGLTPKGIFTSEDAKSYKPRKELFEYALKETGLLPSQVIHIGDSLNSDVKGAYDLEIQAIWLNRSGRKVPENVCAVNNLLEIFSTDYFA